MSYRQLDVTSNFSVADKKRLVAEMSHTYAQMMSVDILRISLAIRELGEGGCWRFPEVGSEPEPVAMLMLDIRRGRTAGLRASILADQRDADGGDGARMDGASRRFSPCSTTG